MEAQTLGELGQTSAVYDRNQHQKNIWDFSHLFTEYLLTSQHHIRHWDIINKRNTSSLIQFNLTGFIIYLYGISTSKKQLLKCFMGPELANSR